jgi:hypothetical protein
MVTPRNFTGEPTSSPWVDSSKYVMACSASRWKRCAPSQKSAPTHAARPSSTKRPSFQ